MVNIIIEVGNSHTEKNSNSVYFAEAVGNSSEVNQQSFGFDRNCYGLFVLYYVIVSVFDSVIYEPELCQ